MVNRANKNASHDDILDSFLTTLETKLRGPFSSLDLAKAVSTAALRGSSHVGSGSAPDDAQDPAREYLHNLSSVFGRTNKVTQCRMLIGLLGLNDMRTNKLGGGDSNASNETDGQYLTPEILRILHETQEASLHEDWVRTTSGLIEGVMFRTRDGERGGNTRESCRSKEATRIIRETGTEVCEKVEGQIQNVGRPYTFSRKQNDKQQRSSIEEEKSKASGATSAAVANKRNRGFTIEKVIPSSQPAIKKEEKIQSSVKQETNTGGTVEQPSPDLNACFAPYRYSLISTPILNTVIPEFHSSKINTNNANGLGDSSCHFQVNPAANILQIDLQLEAQRAKEHGSGVPTKAKGSGNSNNRGSNPSTTANSAKAAFPPGFRPAKLVPPKSDASGTLSGTKPTARSGSGSLFMPKKKPSTNLFNTTTKFRPQAGKTMLRRKVGGAQALMRSGATASGGGAMLSKLGGGSMSGSNAAGRARPGGVGRFSSNRDTARGGGKVSRMKMIDDDDVDTLTKLQQSSNSSANMSDAAERASKRKRILEKGAANQRLKKQKASSPGLTGMQRMESVATARANRAGQGVPQQQQQQTLEWQTLLRDRSNKMSEKDRIRIQQFFTTTNAARRLALLSPEDGGPIYKMKIHEQRGNDPATGQEIKETFYLELDYNTGASSQSKKTKRY